MLVWYGVRTAALVLVEVIVGWTGAGEQADSMATNNNAAALQWQSNRRGIMSLLSIMWQLYLSIGGAVLKSMGKSNG